MDTTEQKKITIRPAADEDFTEIYKIWLEGIGNSYDISCLDMDTVQRQFQSNFFNRHDIFNFWVAENSKDGILGWQCLVPASNNPFHTNKYAESSTYIRKGCRLSGLGKALLNFAVNEAEKSSLEYVIGFVSVTNDISKRIVHDTGFVEVGLIPVPIKDPKQIQRHLFIRPV